MKRILTAAALLVGTIAQAGASLPRDTPVAGTLRAGAARIEITPAVADLPKPFETIRDPLYARAIVLEDRGQRAAIVVADVPTFVPAVYKDLTARISAATGVPVANILLAVSHTHNAVRLDPNPVGLILPGSAKITQQIGDAIVATARAATQHLVPARAGYAAGITAMVGSRPRAGSVDHSRVSANEEEGSDRALGVLKIETLSGEPIGFLINSGLEPVIEMAAPAEISGDVAGAVERYIEQRYDNKPVALYTMSAWNGSALYRSRGAAGVPAADPHALVTAMGTLLGEDVLATIQGLVTTTSLSIAGMLESIDCPGKVTTPLNLPDRCSDAPGATLPRCVFTDKTGPPVSLNLALLRLGDLSIVQADANVTVPILEQLRRAAPPRTIFVSLSYGPVHYIVEDAGYAAHSYPATASGAQQGCVANKFLSTSLAMIQQTGTARAR